MKFEKSIYSLNITNDDPIPGFVISIAEPANGPLNRFRQFLNFTKVCKNAIGHCKGKSECPSTAHMYIPSESFGESFPPYSFGLSCSAPSTKCKRKLQEQRAEELRKLHSAVDFQQLEKNIEDSKREHAALQKEYKVANCKSNKSEVAEAKLKLEKARRENNFFPVGNRAEGLCMMMCVRNV